MAKKLVIVESPAKAKTIEKFLGRGFEVRASMGHIVDLPKKGLGVNTRKDFAPKYEVIENKDKLINELKAASSKADEVYLAPDPDREGEFIAWSLKNVLGLNNPHRAVFHEITKRAVQDAIAHPRLINEDLFNAQQARRVLDRLVGYKISPLLWRRIQSGTSAGRVQSVALRLICDREAEIQAFVPEEYWSITATLSKQQQAERFDAVLISRVKDMGTPGDESGEDGEGDATPGKGTRKGRIKISSKEEADAVLAELQGATYTVLKYEEREQRRQPYLPYTTSTMQQDASVRLYFKPKKTMSVAQQLYEGIELGERGHQGLITYMRTDSTRISEEAQKMVKDFIHDEFGQEYVGPGRTGKAKATTQDAHEAIRPTDVSLTPQSVKAYLTNDQFKLYDLIWKRFVASFMAPAVFDTVRVDIQAQQYVFRANGSNLKFPGFYRVWPREEDEKLLPKMAVNETLDMHKLKPEQHFTQPPPRYTEASLIKELEERGIGRPSTYVPIISTIQDRGYVEQEQRRFMPTWLGITVNEVMNKHFPDIVDTGFTAEMEHKLDEVEEGRRAWTEFLRDFYEGFKVTMEKAEAEMDRVQKPVEELDEKCPECGRNLVIRTGRFGRFISCSGFPECRYGRSFVNKTGAHCPRCGGDLVERKTRTKKRIFYGCNNYPACDFAIWEKPVPELCPNCGGLMVLPKGAQKPVCYQEVIVPQQGEQEAPVQEGETSTKKRRSTSRKATAKENGDASKASKTRKKATTKASSTAKRTKASAAKSGTATRKKTTTAKSKS
ncbi:DNA topoisomerase-1 [Thermosporothrix hazakensis]|jgi:DNA topoisomerase-1|uniref:DNA topoisomerase 1 n=2 Tax=Thermosporothrix TaxID=768650 RepID=A0A326UL62_THEHA|nr:type I DNA topoisomerase [Thermosporothrix hazakensis]PZW33073.1 DNA topoisomerase-1 [Thermosporothrix hazakensis]BBH91051.1 DNA topoisomerase 1 [Thermosporothrix sp. COM3]GCE49104.1 DNA topoisomerase 1 [Thermosporothrix hazakensis]